MPSVNRQLILRSRPQGLLGPGDLQLADSVLPPLADGQALAKVKYLSIDPTMRIWMADVQQYMPPVALGEVMRALGLMEIVESRNAKFQPGDKFTGFTGLQEYLVLTGSEDPPVQKVTAIPHVLDTFFLSTLGITGLTAYFGMTEIAKSASGDFAGKTLVVSAAAGATGSIAGQIGKILGCRVVGIAGADEKCRWLTEELGFDAAVNYKHSNWKEKLIAATPKGIDIDFENVGGEIMQFVLSCMNLFGRVVLCGLISGYNSGDPGLASFSTVLIKRLRVQGFIILDFAPRFTEAATQLAQWKLAGKLKARETIVEGLEKAPDAINMLFAGANTGKLLVKI